VGMKNIHELVHDFNLNELQKVLNIDELKESDNRQALCKQVLSLLDAPPTPKNKYLKIIILQVYNSRLRKIPQQPLQEPVVQQSNFESSPIMDNEPGSSQT